jgi:hypothetical protein
LDKDFLDQDGGQHRMHISWRTGLRLLLIAVAVFLLWGRFGSHWLAKTPPAKPVTDLSQTMPLNQPGGAPEPDEAYEVYSALYQTHMDDPLAFSENSMTDIPQVGASCLKPTTPSEQEMTDSFVAANQQSHRWERKFSIPQDYRLLTNSEVWLLRQCRATNGSDQARCKDYMQFRTVRLLGAPGFDHAHSAALVSIIKSCGHLCGGGGIFAVEKAGGTWKRSATTDFTRDCNWMY